MLEAQCGSWGSIISASVHIPLVEGRIVSGAPPPPPAAGRCTPAAAAATRIPIPIPHPHPPPRAHERARGGGGGGGGPARARARAHTHTHTHPHTHTHTHTTLGLWRCHFILLLQCLGCTCTSRSCPSARPSALPCCQRLPAPLRPPVSAELSELAGKDAGAPLEVISDFHERMEKRGRWDSRVPWPRLLKPHAPVPQLGAQSMPLPTPPRPTGLWDVAGEAQCCQGAGARPDQHCLGGILQTDARGRQGGIFPAEAGATQHRRLTRPPAPLLHIEQVQAGPGVCD